MYLKLLICVTLGFSIFALPPELKAQQPPAISPAGSPAQESIDARPAQSARDVAIERARIMMAEKRYDAGIQA